MLIQLILLLVLVTTACAVPRPETHEQLRRLVRLPGIQSSPALNYDPQCGFVPFPDSAVAKAEIAKLRKEIRNTPQPGGLYLQIARLHQSVGNSSEALSTFLRAREILRKEIAVEPEKVSALCALGEALTATEVFPEAEHYLRKAANLEPKNAAVASAWGRLHLFRAWKKLLSDEDVLGQLSFEANLNEAIENPPDSEELEEISRDLAAAETWFAKALEFDGSKSVLHEQMGGFRHFQSALEGVLKTLRGGERLEHGLRDHLFPAACEREFELALDSRELTPSTAVTAAMVTVFRAQHEQGLEPDQISDGTLWNSLTESERRLVTRALNALERLAWENDKHAVEARELLGCFQFFVMRDFRGAEENLRQAITGGARSERAWDYLSSIYAQSGRGRELIELNEERLQRGSTTRNRILLAKAYDRTGQVEMAQWHTLLALQINANDFTANLALANLLMKSPEAQTSLVRVQDAINKAEKNLGANPSFENMFDLALTRTVYYAMNGELERARKILQEWLEVSRDNKDLQAALEVIGY